MKKQIKLVISMVTAIAMTAAVAIPGYKMTASVTKSHIDEKPVLTFACISDLHNQGPIITEEGHAYRGTIAATIDQMKEQEENVDLIIEGGDVSSDNSTTEDKLYRITDMIQEKMLELTPQTFWITGNHDYNAGEAAYNSADYYNRYVEPSMGDAEGDDKYVETYKGIDYVCGYHYQIKGFDFIALLDSYETLEGGKQHSNYAYSDGTFDWLESTLERIGKEKTVFLVAHFPLRDTKGLSDVVKGMVEPSNTNMKNILLQYPNLFYLYGHDHEKDKAYIRYDTEQRVTEYDVDGNVMNATPATAAPTSDTKLGLNDTVTWTFVKSNDSYNIVNAYNGLKLDVGTNLTTTSEGCLWNVTDNGDDFNIIKADSSEKNGVYYSTSSGTYSYGADGKSTTVALYKKVADTDTVTYVKADSLEENTPYVMVADSNKALTYQNMALHADNDRMLALEVVPGTDSSGKSIITEKEQAVSNDNTSNNDSPEFAERSFTAAFMGSMRYYNNSIDGWVNENDSKVVQALMVYVYDNRVELAMKNYGTGDGGSRELTPYVTERKVVYDYEAAGKVCPICGGLYNGEDYDHSVCPICGAVCNGETFTHGSHDPATPAPTPTSQPTETPVSVNTQPVQQNPVQSPQNLSTVKTSVIAPATPKSVKSKRTASKVKISYKKVKGANGYEIQFSIKKKGSYKKLGISKSTNLTTKKLKKGKRYYVKVRAYIINNGKKVYSSYSKPVKVK